MAKNMSSLKNVHPSDRDLQPESTIQNKSPKESEPEAQSIVWTEVNFEDELNEFD